MERNNPTESLASLVEKVKDAKQRRSERDPAFVEIVRRFQDMAFGYAYSVVGDFHHAEDIAQEAFMEAWIHIEDLRDTDAFPGWFRKIVRKRCDRHVRRKELRTEPLEEALTIASDRANERGLAERNDVLDTVRSLPEPERQMTALFYVNGYSHSEIADFLETTPATVNNRLRSARRLLRERMVTMATADLHARRPSRNDNFVNEAIKRPPELGADKWAIFVASDKGDMDIVRRMLNETPELLTADYAYWQPIHFAARAGRTEVVKLLLERGADPMASVWWHGYSLPIDMASDRGHTEVVALLELAMKRNSKVEGDRGKPLCDAVRNRDFSRIAALLDAEPELVNVAERVTGRDFLSQLPLHIAVDMDDFRLVEILLDRGANIEGTRSDGYKPIHLAVWSGPGRGCRNRWNVVQYLLDRGAEYSPSVAAARNDLDAVRRMLDENPSRVHELDTCGNRPISCAAEHHHVEMVKFLLEQGADPNLPEANSDKGYALYSVTFVREHVGIARLLLEAGASVRSNRESSGDPTYAIVAGLWQPSEKSPELVELLYEYGATIGIGLAARAGRLDIVAEILAVDSSKAQDALDGAGLHPSRRKIVHLAMKYGAKVVSDPKAVYPWGTALWGPIRNRQVEAADYLLEHGADINWQNWKGQSPLHHCIMLDRPDMLEWALDRGADIEARDWELESRPLAWAAFLGNKRIVEILLERGAKVHHPDDRHWNAPVARAEKAGHPDIADMLKRHVRG